jgi:hypothetical protein
MPHRAQHLGWRRIGPPLIRRQSRNHWPNHGLLIQLGRADQHERACAAITSTLSSGTLPVRSRPWPLASCVSTYVCDLDWLVPVGTDDSPPRRDRPLAMRDVAVPFLCYPSLKIFRSSLSVGPGHPPVTDVARNFVSCSPFRCSPNPSTVERWACGECCILAPVEGFGSGSTCRWRRSAVVRKVPRVEKGSR